MEWFECSLRAQADWPHHLAPLIGNLRPPHPPQHSEHLPKSVHRKKRATRSINGSDWEQASNWQERPSCLHSAWRGFCGSLFLRVPRDRQWSDRQGYLLPEVLLAGYWQDWSFDWKVEVLVRFVQLPNPRPHKALPCLQPLLRQIRPPLPMAQQLRGRVKLPLLHHQHHSAAHLRTRNDCSLNPLRSRPQDAQFRFWCRELFSMLPDGTLPRRHLRHNTAAALACVFLDEGYHDVYAHIVFEDEIGVVGIG